MSTNNYYNTYLHPLQKNNGTFVKRKNSTRRLSVSSDMSDPEDVEVQEQVSRRRKSMNPHNWNLLLSQFNAQPDMIQLIQMCKAEEENRRLEETKMKLKEYQVLSQLQSMQARQSFEGLSSSSSSSPLRKEEFKLQLPPLSHN
jgi:hypothetical protein